MLACARPTKPSMSRAFVVVACLLCFAACRNKAQLISQDIAAAASVEDTTLGPGDVFEVRVFGQDDLSGKYKVGTDGSVQFPFLGVVQAGGKQPEDVAHDISTGLKSGGYLNDPHVSVMVAETNSKRLSVIGAVAKPGTL